MLRSESIIMIREKVLEGKSAYAVSKGLGFSKNTVKKYVDPKNTDKHGYPTRSQCFCYFGDLKFRNIRRTKTNRSFGHVTHF